MRRLYLAAAVLLLFFAGCAGMPSAGDDLDLAIRDASDYLNDNIAAGSKIAVLNIESGSENLSDYVIEELISNAVNDRIFLVVDRAQIELIRTEQNFQFSGEVDDKTALEIGRFLGAEIIVSGRISELGDRYRMTIRALDVQTAQVLGQYNRNIASGRTITALASGGRSVIGTTSSSRGTSAGQTAQRPLNGTYTFYPRLRAYMGAAEAQAYISHIVIRGEYMNIYITGVAQGSYQHPGHSMISIAANSRNVILQDLDNPSRTYNPIGINNGWEWDADNRWYPFRGVTARRFSLKFDYDNPPIIWEEINLGDAEFTP